MIKTIVVGFCSGIAAIASGHAVEHFRDQREAPLSPGATVRLETRKTKEINVPKIRDGVVKGYVVAQLSYVVSPALLEKSSLSPDSFVVDETFRYLYEDETIDFDHLDKFDLKKMTATLAANINRRIRVDAVSDVGIQEFTFMATPEAKAR